MESCGSFEPLRGYKRHDVALARAKLRQPSHGRGLERWAREQWQQQGAMEQGVATFGREERRSKQGARIAG